MNPQKSKNKKVNKLRNRKAGSSNVVALKQSRFTHPPPYIAQSIRSFHLRCLATGAEAGVSFAYFQLAGLLGIIDTSATTSVFWTSVFRLRSVEIWSPVATAGTPVTASVTYTENAADFESPPVTMSDTSVSFDFPAHIMSKPPRGSLASKWHGSGQTDELFALTYSSGSTVDFCFDFILSDIGVPIAGPTITGGTAGNLHHKIVNNLTPNAVNSL
jgi:hypothetical protein